MILEQVPMIEQVRRQGQVLESRDLRLWSINALMTLVVSAGFLALLLPNVVWNVEMLRFDRRFLPQLFFGFIALIVLYNVYMLEQRRDLRTTREELLRQLLRTEAAETLSLIDPLTEIFNRRYLDEILGKETNRADRQGTDLSFVVIDVDNFKSVNTRFGHFVGDRLLNDVARLLVETFRRSDTVIRYGGDEFVVILPDTSEQQAGRACERLLAKVDGWNREHSLPGHSLSLSCGLSTYRKGADVKDLLEAADKRMYLDKSSRSVA